MTPAQAYRDGEPGFYVVERRRDSAVGGPFAHELSARNVRLALDAGLAGGLYDVVRLADCGHPASDETSADGYTFCAVCAVAGPAGASGPLERMAARP